jgi:hypothetical protein
MVRRVPNLTKAERGRASDAPLGRRTPPPLPKRAAPRGSEPPGDVSFPRPRPRLVLPIVAPWPAHSAPGRSAVPRSPLPPLPVPPAPRLAPPSLRHEILPPHVPSPSSQPAPSRRLVFPRLRLWLPSSHLPDVLGFALAWLLTVGAAAIVAGHVIARSQLPAVVWLPFNPAAGTPPSTQVSCPQSWEPPVMAVSDLPVAGSTRGAVSRGFYAPAQRPLISARPPTRSSSGGETSAPDPPAATRHTKATEGAKSLGDWMREAVGPT